MQHKFRHQVTPTVAPSLRLRKIVAPSATNWYCTSVACKNMAPTRTKCVEFQRSCQSKAVKKIIYNHYAKRIILSMRRIEMTRKSEKQQEPPEVKSLRLVLNEPSVIKSLHTDPIFKEKDILLVASRDYNLSTPFGSNVSQRNFLLIRHPHKITSNHGVNQTVSR